MNEFLMALAAALQSKSLRSLTLSRPIERDAPQRQSVHPIQLRGELAYQWKLRVGKQETHLNLSAGETTHRVAELLGPAYREANLQTDTDNWNVQLARDGLKIRRRETLQPPVPLPVVPGHDRDKQYLIPPGVPCPFLVSLDVMTPAGQVRQARQKKFRQINRYLELVNDVFEHLPTTGPIRVLDFGCGLSYLTFAVHHLLTKIHAREVQLVGVDQNPHVISRCREIAAELGIEGMTFTTERIESLQPGTFDMVISLHACDTATDQALALAVQAEARIILAAPCCQHELSPGLQLAGLDEILRHGILRERIAALLTDGLRGAALEAAGYRTRVLEFIDLEHTPKNLLIRGVRRVGPVDNCNAGKRYSDIKTSLGVSALATDAIVAASRSTP